MKIIIKLHAILKLEFTIVITTNNNNSIVVLSIKLVIRLHVQELYVMLPRYVLIYIIYMCVGHASMSRCSTPSWVPWNSLKACYRAPGSPTVPSLGYSTKSYKLGTYISDNPCVSAKVIVNPGVICKFNVFFDPIKKGRAHCDVKIIVENNPYEYFTVRT